MNNKSFVNVKDFGAIGDGVNDDTSSIQSAIDSTPLNGCLYFPKGSYKAYAVQVTKSITIFGDGKGATELVFGQEYGAATWNGKYLKQTAYFNLSGGLDFYIRDLTMVDKFGLRATGKNIRHPHPSNTGWPIQPMGIAGNHRDSLVPSDFPNYIEVQNVKFLDLYTPIQINAKKIIAQNNEFLWSYGKAGIGIPIYQLGNGTMPGGKTGIIAGDPHAAILGCFGTAIIKNNYFNGLIDETFAKSNKPANWELYRIPAENFIENQMRQVFVDAWMTSEDGTHDYSDNTVVNHGIEGIHFYTGYTVDKFPQRSSLSISNNFIKPFQNNYEPWYTTTNPCISLGGRLPATKVVGNRIENTYTGISVDPIHFVSSGTPTPSLVGNIQISNNVMNGVVVGISVNKLSEKDQITNNTIFCESKPSKLAMANLNAKNIFPPKSYSDLFGIYIKNCNPLVANNVLSAEYEWDLVTTLVAQKNNVLTLADTKGIDKGFGLTILLPNDARTVPVLSVSDKNVTVDPAWLSGAKIPINSTVYWSKNAPHCSGGIVVVNQQANLKQNFFGTIIKGFLRDFATVDYPNAGGQSSTLINTTTIGVTQQTSSRFPKSPYKSDGFYSKI